MTQHVTAGAGVVVYLPPVSAFLILLVDMRSHTQLHTYDQRFNIFLNATRALPFALNQRILCVLNVVFCVSASEGNYS